MRKVTAAEFQKETGKYQDMAQREPITITKHDRPSWVLLSFEEYQQLTGSDRRVLHVAQLSEKDLEILSRAKVPDEYKHLDDELEE